MKFFKEERGIYSVQPSAETAEDLNQDDILRFSANISNNPHDFFESKLFLEGDIQKQTAANAAWVPVEDADNVTLELSGFYKMFKEMSLKFSNDSEIEKVTHLGEVATINQFIMNEYDYPNTRSVKKVSDFFSLSNSIQPNHSCKAWAHTHTFIRNCEKFQADCVSHSFSVKCLLKSHNTSLAILYFQENFIVMTEQIGRRYCITFCQKLGNTQIETIRKICC